MHRKEPSPELLAKYPNLLAWPILPKMRSAALAAKNLRLLLKEAFPGIKFKIGSEYYSNGSSIHAKCELFQMDGYTKESARVIGNQADKIAEQFSYGTFDGMTDSYNYKDNPEIRAFQDAFGSAQYVIVNASLANEASEERERQARAEKRKKKLGKIADDARPKGRKNDRESQNKL